MKKEELLSLGNTIRNAVNHILISNFISDFIGLGEGQLLSFIPGVSKEDLLKLIPKKLITSTYYQFVSPVEIISYVFRANSEDPDIRNGLVKDLQNDTNIRIVANVCDMIYRDIASNKIDDMFIEIEKRAERGSIIYLDDSMQIPYSIEQCLGAYKRAEPITCICVITLPLEQVLNFSRPIEPLSEITCCDTTSCNITTITNSITDDDKKFETICNILSLVYRAFCPAILHLYPSIFQTLDAQKKFILDQREYLESLLLASMVSLYMSSSTKTLSETFSIDATLTSKLTISCSMKNDVSTLKIDLDIDSDENEEDSEMEL